MTNRSKSIAYALLVMLLWGALFPLVKVGYQVFSVDTASVPDMLVFAGARFLVCGAVICLFSLIQNPEHLKSVRKTRIGVLLSGFISVTLHYGFSYIALGMTASSKTAIIKQIGALFYICASCLLPQNRGNKAGMRVFFGAVLGFAGIITINAESGSGISFGYGDMLIFCASFCTVFSNMISKRVFLLAEPVAATGVSQFAGGFLLLLLGFAGGGKLIFLPDKRVLVFAVICALTIVSYCIWYRIVKYSALSRLFLIKFTEPLFACIFSALLLGEPILRWQYAAAFVLITAGICLADTDVSFLRNGTKVRTR